MRAATGTAKRNGRAGILGSGFSALRAVDPILLLPSLALLGTGILFVYSSGVNSAGISVSNEWIKQIVWASSGLVLMVAFAVTNHQRYKARTPYIFLAALALLVVTLMFGAPGERRAFLAGYRRPGHPAVRVRQDRDHSVPGRLPVGDRQRRRGIAALPARPAGGGGAGGADRAAARHGHGVDLLSDLSDHGADGRGAHPPPAVRDAAGPS